MTKGTGHEGHTIFWNLGGGEAEQQMDGSIKFKNSSDVAQSE